MARNMAQCNELQYQQQLEVPNHVRDLESNFTQLMFHEDVSNALLQDKFRNVISYPLDIDELLWTLPNYGGSFVNEKYLKVYLQNGQVIGNVYDLLQFCASNDYHQIVHALLVPCDASKVNLNDQQLLEPIFIAARFGCVPYLERWVDNGLPVDLVNQQGQSLLHCASLNLRFDSNFACIKLLLDRGADPNFVCTDDDSTPYEYLLSTYENHYLLKKAMVEFSRSGVNVNRRTMERKETVLFFDRVLCNPACILHLVANGIDVNAKTTEGGDCLQVVFTYLFNNGSFNFVRVTATDRKMYEPVKVLLLHIEKMRVLQLSIDEATTSAADMIKRWLSFVENAMRIANRQRYSAATSEDNGHNFIKKCQAERKKMEQTKLDSRNSLYELLFKNSIALSKLVKRQEYKSYFKSNQHKVDFPINWHFLQAKFNEGVVRNLLLPYAYDRLVIDLELPLPDLCLENILENMDNSELKDLVKNGAVLKTSEQVNVPLLIRYCEDILLIYGDFKNIPYSMVPVKSL